jgi:phage terminase Nu1 subunit (DNA packaging protein)
MPKATQQKIDQLLTEIAKKHLSLETLETRNSDSLDFHDVAVWSLKGALQEAYEAGLSAKR